MNWLILAIACLISWGLWGLLIKLAYRGAEWSEIYLISSLTSFAIALAIFLASHTKIHFKPSLLLALGAGLTGGIGNIFFVKALEHGKASIVIPLTALYPVITAVLAVIILHEKLSMLQLIGIVLAIIAMILLSL